MHPGSVIVIVVLNSLWFVPCWSVLIFAILVKCGLIKCGSDKFEYQHSKRKSPLSLGAFSKGVEKDSIKRIKEHFHYEDPRTLSIFENPSTEEILWMDKFTSFRNSEKRVLGVALFYNLGAPVVNIFGILSTTLWVSYGADSWEGNLVAIPFCILGWTITWGFVTLFFRRLFRKPEGYDLYAVTSKGLYVIPPSDTDRPFQFCSLQDVKSFGCSVFTVRFEAIDGRVLYFLSTHAEECCNIVRAQIIAAPLEVVLELLVNNKVTLPKAIIEHIISFIPVLDQELKDKRERSIENKEYNIVDSQGTIIWRFEDITTLKIDKRIFLSPALSSPRLIMSPMKGADINLFSKTP